MMRNRLFVLSVLASFFYASSWVYADPTECKQAYIKVNRQFENDRKDLIGTESKLVKGIAYATPAACVLGGFVARSAIVAGVCVAGVAGIYGVMSVGGSSDLQARMAKLEDRRKVYEAYLHVQNGDLSDFQATYAAKDLRNDREQDAFNQRFVEAMNSGKFCEKGQAGFDEAVQIAIGESALTN